MAEKPLNFAERAAELRRKRDEERRELPEPRNTPAAEPSSVVHAVFGTRSEEPQRQPPTERPARETLAFPSGSVSLMRMMARLGKLHGDEPADRRGIDLFTGGGEEEFKKFERLRIMEAKLTSLRGQMSAAREAANVAMRRDIMREAGTEDLINQFWNSTEHDWSARPSTYIALLDELESRGFFEPAQPDPEPEPPAPEPWHDPAEHNPEGDKPRSPGRPHRGRPKRR